MLDQRLIDIINAHALIIIGTSDRGLVPAIARGFGARANAERTAMEVLVTRLPSRKAFENLQQTGRIAVTFTAPETFESYQIKGRVTSCSETTPDDDALAQAYCKRMVDRLAAIGAPNNPVGLIFMTKDIFRVGFDIDAAFLQTPGKDAGKKL